MKLNKVILMGRLTRDPETKYTAEKLAITDYALAVDRPYKKEGKETDFINCTAFGKSAEFVSKYFKKGQKVAVAGRLQVDSWTDTEGRKRTSTKVITDEHHFADNKQTAQKQEDSGFYPVEEGIEEEDLPCGK